MYVMTHVRLCFSQMTPKNKKGWQHSILRFVEVIRHCSNKRNTTARTDYVVIKVTKNIHSFTQPVSWLYSVLVQQIAWQAKSGNDISRLTNLAALECTAAVVRSSTRLCVETHNEIAY